MKVRHVIEWHHVETVDKFKLFYMLITKGGYVFRVISF